ncbi:MAG: hypothetical protein GY711_04955 [bacterium]|nr:hypothetical protein [bacterium]
MRPRIVTRLALVAAALVCIAVARYVQGQRWERRSSRELTARLHELQPLVEGVLEHVFEAPVQVQAVPSHELRNTFTPENVLSELATDERRRIELAEHLVDRHFRELGTIEERTGTIILDPRPMHAAGLADDSHVDALLAHDLAHLYQFQVLGARGFLETDQPGAVRLERLAILEAHAEYVAREVIAQLGAPGAHRGLAKWHARREREIAERFGAPVPRVYGSGADAFRELVRSLGYPAAVEARFGVLGRER